MSQKTCNKCKASKLLTDFAKATGRGSGYRNECKECAAAYGREYRRNNLARLQLQSRRHKLSKYGLTISDYAAMSRKQKHRCAICRIKPLAKLYVDHCHKSGKVRGLLCMACNIALGKFRDNPKFLSKAIEYLNTHRSRA